MRAMLKSKRRHLQNTGAIIRLLVSGHGLENLPALSRHILVLLLLRAAAVSNRSSMENVTANAECETVATCCSLQQVA
jgi:hypothetical protein